jgi:16S rRNA (uracil1498-N3)-methyltransferase
MTLPRFHVPDLPAEGAALVLPPAVLHHARHVLRLGTGAALCLFDGRGREVEATVERAWRGSLTVRIGAVSRSAVEPRLAIVLAVAPLKGDLMALVVQKSTELGVAEIQPVLAARTEPKEAAAVSGAGRRERLRRIAVAAAEQCGRACVPDISPPVPLAQVLQRDVRGPRLMLCERGGAMPPAAGEAPPAEALLLVGPTGGWEDQERARARAAGFLEVTLGPRILRAETAALAALAAIQTHWGDFAGTPGGETRG